MSVGSQGYARSSGGLYLTAQLLAGGISFAMQTAEYTVLYNIRLKIIVLKYVGGF